MATIETSGGVRLHAAVSGGGRPVLLVHGWSLSHRAFAPQIAQLSSRYRVIAPDLRGHGHSESGASACTVDDHAADLAAVCSSLGVEDAVLAGWSWGAEVALAALPALGARVAGLALVSATPRFTAGEGWPHGLAEARVRAIRARLGRAPDETRRAFFEGMFAEGELSAADRERLAAEQLSAPLDLTAARGALDALAATDLRERVAEARHVPVLFVHGERDAICLPAASAWMAERLPSARREVLPGAGHAPQLSRPDEVTSLLAAFAEALR